jgi:glutamate carboxypeptidase
MPLLAPLLALTLWAQSPPNPTAVLPAIDRDADTSIALLEKLVNINSGSYNLAGVKAVAAVIDPELKALGFTTRTIPLDEVKRSVHLYAERKGKNTRMSKPVLLIGHMDTVFEQTSPFQKFERKGTQASGPGVSDMKGGIVVMLSALKGLQAAGLLDNLWLTIFFTGDEEDSGDPLAVTRRDFIAAGKAAKAALCFETGVRRGNLDYATTARRGYVDWELRVKGVAGHSGGIFSEKLGHGAIFELSRILNDMHDKVREPNMTFNVGMILGGNSVQPKEAGSGSVTGKINIVPAEAIARGEIRALSLEQVARIKDKMHGIVASRNLPGTSAEIKFDDGFPPMSPTAGNKQLLAVLNQASKLAGLPQLGELDPMERGAGDISVIAPYVDSLSGLGAIGAGAHAIGETVDLTSIPRQAKRAALLVHLLGN